MMKRVLLLLVMVLFSCQGKNVDTQKNIKNKIKVNKETYEMIRKAKGFSELFTLKKVIQLESNEECLIGEIESVIYLKEENKIIVFDRYTNREIYFFNSDGKYLNKISSRGLGPGEYLKPINITYENGVLVVYVDDNKFLLYNLNGKLLREEVIEEGDIYRYMQKIILYNNDLFCYTIGAGFESMSFAEECRIFKFKNCESFEKSFAAKPEKSFDFDFGDMTLMDSTILFTSLFNGKIYQIDPVQNNMQLFADLGELTDANKISSKKNPMQYIMKNMNEIDAILGLGPIRNFIFIERIKGFTVISPDGKVVARNLKRDYKHPKGFEGYSMRKGFVFFNDGVIYASTTTENLLNNEIPNPSLLIYQIRNDYPKIKIND